MFDASFKELLLILVLGLLVLGPERLPKVAAEIGKWVARARRTATQLRRQLEREIELDDAIQSRRERERREAAQRASEDLSRSASGEMPPSDAGAADGSPTIHAPPPGARDAPADAANPVDSADSSDEAISEQIPAAPAEHAHPSVTGAEPETVAVDGEQRDTEAAPRVHEEPPRV